MRQEGKAARKEHVHTGSTYRPGMQGTRAISVEHTLMLSESSPSRDAGLDVFLHQVPSVID